VNHAQYANQVHDNDTVVRLTDSDGKHADSVVDMSASSSVLGSISQPADLLLGDLRAYSQVENIPIWHQ